MSPRKSFHPDNYTYTILLSVCEHLLPREQVERRFINAKKLFEQCCETGYVNDYVLGKLRQAIPNNRYIALVGGTAVNSASELPEQWTKSVNRPTRRKQLVGNTYSNRK
jgi:hypothetical protein